MFYISVNQTDKPEKKMRRSCEFWFCGEQKQKKKINAADSISRAAKTEKEREEGGEEEEVCR